MTRFEIAEWLVIAVPVVGATGNFICQFGLVRLRGGRSLGLCLMTAFIAGGAATLTGMAIVVGFARFSFADSIGLITTALLAYASAGFVLFAVVNLGQTSLRVRMIRQLMQSPQGLTPAQLLALQSDAALIEVRIRRMKEAGQVKVAGGRLYPRLSALFLASAGISLLQQILYGRADNRPRNGPRGKPSQPRSGSKMHTNDADRRD